MTFPSAGCQTCKTRRIKCDEAKPVCQKCLKSKRICYGMRAGQDSSIIHLENSYASGRTKRPRGPRSAPNARLATLNLDTVLDRPLKVDLATQATMYYLHYHLRAPKDTSNILWSFSDDLLPLCMAKSDTPMLDLALSSMALVLFSRTQHHPPAAIEASMRYHRLLRIAQKTILSLDEGNIDSCLLAIFFMSRYEDAIHRPNNANPRTSAYRHHDGAFSILKIWKEGFSRRQPPTDVIKHTRRGLIRSAQLRTIPLPEWMLDGEAFGEHGLELEYDRVSVRITTLRHQLSILLEEKSSQQDLAETRKLKDEVLDIDNALQAWIHKLPRSWGYQSHTLPTSQHWPERDFCAPDVYLYSNSICPAVWTQYFSMKMLVNSTRLRILKLHPSDSDDDSTCFECLSNIKVATDGLAAGLPFFLQKVEVTRSTSSNVISITVNKDNNIKPYIASRVVWPLTIASSLGDVDLKQRQWFKSELVRLGRILGFGVIEHADPDGCWFDL